MTSRKLAIAVPMMLLCLAGCNRNPSAATDEDDAAEMGNDESSVPDLPAECTLPAPEGGCSVWCQDCPDGEKCVLEGPSYLTTACVPKVASPLEVAADCDLYAETDECGPTAMCFPYGTGVCVEFCSGTPADPSCSEAGSRCHQWNDGVTAVCADACDPRVASPCGDPDLACRVIDEDCEGFACGQAGNASGTFCVLYSESEATAGLGEPCQGVSFCQKDLACAPAELVPGCDESAGGGCCTQYCDIGSSSCPAGSECESVYSDPPGGLESLGLCVASG